MGSHLIHGLICGVLLYLWIGTAYSITEYDYTNICTNGYKQTINLMSPILNSVDSTGILLTRSYPNNANCTIVINPWFPSDSIILSIRRLEIPTTSCYDKLTVTNSNGRSSLFCSYIFDPEERQTVVSSGQMTITFTAKSFHTSSYRGFELIYTAFRTGTYCSQSMFNCDNGRCIADSLKCSAHNHCGDRSDVVACDISAGAISGYVILCIILVVGFVSCIVCFRRRRRVIRETTVLHPPPIRNTAATIYQPTYQPSPGSYQYPTSTTPYTAIPPPPPYQESAPAYNPNFKQ